MEIKYTAKLVRYSSDGWYVFRVSKWTDEIIDIDNDWSVTEIRLWVGKKELSKVKGIEKRKLWDILSNCWRMTIPIDIRQKKITKINKDYSKRWLVIDVSLEGWRFEGYEIIENEVQK